MPKWLIDEDPTILERLCERIALGERVPDICKREDMPAIGTFLRWIATRDDARFDALREAYARAREIRAHEIFEEAIEISDDSSGDHVVIDGKPVPVPENVQRSRLRVDTRKWAAGKLLPSVYGERLDLNVEGKVSHEFSLSDAVPEWIAERLDVPQRSTQPPLLEHSPVEGEAD